jgi:hypothetical protein
MATQGNYSPERIADRLEITDVMYRWCRSIDRLDMDGIRSVFHPDATDDHAAFKGDVEGLIAWITQRHKTIPFSMHQISNILIEFALPDVALVETYVWCVQRYPPEARASLTQLTGGKGGESGGSTDSMSCVRYVDRFERRAGEWRIAERTVVMDWKTLFDVPTNAPQFPATWVQGTRNQSDFLFQQRRKLGISK